MLRGESGIVAAKYLLNTNMETLAEQYAKIGIRYTEVPADPPGDGIRSAGGVLLEPLVPDGEPPMLYWSWFAGEAVYFTCDDESG